MPTNPSRSPARNIVIFTATFNYVNNCKDEVLLPMLLKPLQKSRLKITKEHKVTTHLFQKRRRRLGSPFQRLEIDMGDTKSRRKASTPLEIIHEG